MKTFTSSTARTLKSKGSSSIKDACSKLFTISMFLFLVSYTSLVQAQFTKTASTGNWNTSGTWSPSGVPASVDNVVIPAGVTVTGDVTTTVGSITFGNASASTATLSVNSGVVILVTNGVTQNNAAGVATNAAITGSGTINCSTFTMGSGVTPTAAVSFTFTSSIADFNITNDLTLNCYDPGGGKKMPSIFNLSTGSLYVGGRISCVGQKNVGSTFSMATGSQNATLSFGGATPFALSSSDNSGTVVFTVNLSGTSTTVDFSGTSAQTIPFTYPASKVTTAAPTTSALTYTNLTVNNTNASGATFSAAVTSTSITGNISVGNVNSTSLLNTNNLAVARGASDAISVALGSTLNAGTSVISWGGASGSITINGKFQTANSVGLTGSTTTAINTTTNSPSVTLGGSSTIEYNASGAQAVTLRTYSNLTLSNSGTKTFGGVTTISGNMEINGTAKVTFSNSTNSTANSLSLGGYGQNLGSWGGTGSGATYINTTYFNATTNGKITISAATCTAGVWLGTTSSNWGTATNWCGSIPDSTTDVIIPSGTANQPTIGAAAVCNSITINSGATLIITGTNTLKVTGNFTNNGTFTANSSTVTFDATSGTQTLNTGGNSFFNISHVAASSLQLLTNNLTTGGTFTNSAGTFDANSLTNTVTGLTTISGGTYLAGSTTQTFNGALTLSGGTFTGAGGTITSTNVTVSSGTLTAPSGTFNITGDWTTNNGGTFNHNSGTVTFKGTTQAIGGTASSTFNNLIIDAGAVVSMNNSNTCASLTFNASSTASSLTQANGILLSINGTVTINQPIAAVTTAWNINAATATVSGLITLAGSNTTASRIGKIAITTGTLNANGGLTFVTGLAADHVIDMSGGAGTLNLIGALTVPAASATLTSSTTSIFDYADANAQTINYFSAGSYSNLYIDNTNTTSGATLSAGITTSNVTGNVVVGNVNSGTLFTTGNFAIGFNNSKSLTVAANSTINAGTSVVTHGTSGTTTINGRFKTANTVGFSGSSTTAINSTNNPTITLGPSSTIEYNAAGVQPVAARSYANLALSNSGNKTISASTSISGNLAISGTAKGLLTNGTSTSVYSLTLGGTNQTNGLWGSTGATTATNKTDTWFVQANTGVISDNYPCTAGTWIGAFSNDYNDVANWCGGIPTSSTNIIISTTTTTNQPVIGNTGLVCKDITIYSGGSLSITGSNSLTVSGNWLNQGSFTASTGTVTFNGGTQTIGGTSPNTFNNLILNGTAASLTANISVSGNLSVSTGSLDLSTFSADRTSTGGTLTISNGTSVKIGGTNTLPANYSAHSIGATSTVEYSGTNQNIAALNSSQNYGNLIISGSGTKTLSGTIGIAGDLTLSPGNTLNLSTYTANRTSAGGTLTIPSGSSLLIGGTNTLPSNFSTHSIGTTSTINYSGTNQSIATLNSSQNYGNIVMSGSGTKTLSGNIGVASDWTRNAGTTFEANSKAVSFNGSGNSNITAPNVSTRDLYGVFGGERFYDLTINKSSKSVNVSTGLTSSANNLAVRHSLNLTTGTLNIGDSSVVLISRNDTTADLTQVNTANAAVAYSGNGRFVPQRFISNPSSVRTWRYFTVPLQANDPLTISQAWQEGVSSGNPAPGFGTLITGPGGTTNGFDASPQNKYSIQYFNNTTTPNSWGYPANTNLRIMSQPAWVVFIRGDRSASVSGPYNPSGNLVLEPKGKLNYGDTTYTISSGKFNLIGNPYPARVNMATVFDASNNPHPTYRLWDPKAFVNYTQTGTYVLFKWLAGAYQQVNNAGTTWTTPGTVESGEAIMIDTIMKTTAIKFHESDKVSGTSTLNGIQSRPFGANSQLAAFYTKLGFYDVTDSTYKYIDGTSNLYYPDFDSTVVASEDYIAPTTGLGTLRIAKSGFQLYIDAVPAAQLTDVIQLNTKLNQGQHRLAFYSNNFDLSLQPIAVDNYTGNTVPIVVNDTDSTFLDFTVTSDPLSNSLNRFKIIFRPQGGGPLPMRFSNVRAYQLGSEISVDWKVENQQDAKEYMVEKSTDGINFTAEIRIPSNRNISAIYNWVDGFPFNGNNFYRIRLVNESGVSSYSQIVTVNIGNNKVRSINVYPNPIRNNTINLQFENYKPGNYKFQLFSQNGQLVFNKTITGIGNSWSESVFVNTLLSHGSYNLVIKDEEGKKYVQNIIVE